MSEAKANKVESKSDAKVAASSTTDTASDARATLSNSIQDMMKDAVTGGKAAADATSPDGTSSAVGQLGRALENKSGESPSSMAGKMAEAVTNGAGSGASKILENMTQNGEVQKQIDKNGSALDSLLKGGVGINDLSRYKEKVTDQDRKEAKEALEKGISGLVPEADRKLQVAMQNAIVDGDMGKFQEAVKALGNDPEKLAKMVKEVNENLNKNETFGGVDLSMDSKGNVLLYNENGNTAVSVNSKTGETTLKAVERQADGSVLLKDGEIINRKAADVMKDLGEDATRSITDLPLHKLIQPGDKHPFPGKPIPFPNLEPRSPGWPQQKHEGGKGNLDKGHLDFTPLKELLKSDEK